MAIQRAQRRRHDRGPVEASSRRLVAMMFLGVATACVTSVPPPSPSGTSLTRAAPARPKSPRPQVGAAGSRDAGPQSSAPPSSVSRSPAPILLDDPTGTGDEVEACPGAPPAPDWARSDEADADTWKALLMTGDASIDAFDNARRALRDLWLHRGLAPASLRELSAADDSAADDVATGRGVAPTSRVTIRAALAALAPRPRDKCLVHMTSHGSPQGFYLAGQRPLQPAELDRMLRFACGTRPTVVLVSACYSGRFLEGEMRRSNRVILTAARADRPSFGCGTDDVFPYWDHCIIDNFASAPTWRALYARARRCVRAKEAAGGFEPSEPQAFFGKDVRDLPIFGTPLARGG